jgi:glycine/D-amino acid oxidase-like deaminating enzyme
VQPARLALGLRAAALGKVRLYEQTHVSRIDDGVVATSRGRVRGKNVVVAVNAAAAGWKPLRRQVTVFGSYVVLTEPVPELLEQIGWTGGEAVLDGRMFLHYFRTTNDGRVLMGSGSGPIGFGGKIDARFWTDRPTVQRAERGLRRLLPGLADARVTHAWGGPIDVSPTHLPIFGSRGRVHHGFGFTGNGVGPTYLGGEILARLALDRRDGRTALAIVEPSRKLFPPEPFRYVGGSFIRRGLLRKDALEDEGREPDLPTRVVTSLPRLLGLHLPR